MANLQKTLDALQPYVIGIRYIDKMTVIDVIFKTGWTLPESNNVKKVKGDDETLNYYMIFSDIQDVTIDDLLEYVSNVIKLNIEREKKHDLLRIKVNELKEFFKNHTLLELTNLKFTLHKEEDKEEDLVPQLNDFDTNLNDIDNLEITSEQEATPEVNTIIDETQLSEDEIEMLKEETRAENYKKFKESKSNVKKSYNVELPPKKTIMEMIGDDKNSTCECGANEACNKCIDTKY